MLMKDSSLAAQISVTFLVRLKNLQDITGDAWIKKRQSNWPAELIVHIVTGKDSNGCVEYLTSRSSTGGSRLAIMPSVLENSPNVVLESISYSILFVATAVGGTPELIDPRDHDTVLIAYGSNPLRMKLLDILQHGHHVARARISLATTKQQWIVLNQLQIVKRKKWQVTDSPSVCATRTGEYPLVSVIITTFNRPKLLPRAIKSVFDSKYAHVEAVIVDDASPKPTQQLRLATLDDLFPEQQATPTSHYSRKITVVINDHNVYLGQSRNNGVYHARGDLLVFMDDDDILLPQAIGKMVDTLCTTGSDFTGMRPWIYHASKAPDAKATYNSDWAVAGGTAVGGLFLNAFGNLLMVRRESFYAAGRWSTERAGCEDWELWARLVLMGGYREKEVEPLFLYRMGHSDSMFGSMSDFRCEDRVHKPFRKVLPVMLKNLPEISMYMHHYNKKK